MQSLSQNIVYSLGFLRQTVEKRLQHHFGQKEGAAFILQNITDEQTEAHVKGFTKLKLDIDEYIIVLLALVPHIQPNFLDELVEQYLPQGGDFAEMGGVKGMNHRSAIPTGETAQFIIAGRDIGKRLEVQKLLLQGSRLHKKKIVMVEPLKEGEPYMSGRLVLSSEYVDKVLFDRKHRPSFSPEFPARLTTTKMEWNDLVVNEKTMQQVEDMKTWLLHNETLLQDWGMAKKIKAGFRALFYGPSGTGKTLTATLLGKEFIKDVYRIDLSQVVSKYIGETEKNLEKIFARAEDKGWILFFDEADALFGKRTNVSSAHDKYANQEVSYLLQRVEDFPGLIILASNYKTNIDQAFIRRFNAIIHFPMPTHQERLALWRKTLPAKATFSEEIDLEGIASKYELSGSAILNVVQYTSLQSINKNTNILSKPSLLEGIKREYEKEERVFM